MEILTLLKANLKHKKGSFISILVLMLIISTVLTSVLSIKDNMRTRMNDALDTVNSGDLVIYMEKKALSKDILTKARACKGVKDIKTVSSMMMSSTSINGKSISTNLFLQACADNQYPYSVYNTSATDFLDEKPVLKDNELLLPISMKTTYDCTIGDIVSFNLGTTKKEFTIAGFMEEPLSGSNVMGLKMMLISDHAYREIRTLTNIEKVPDNNYIWDGTLVHVFASKEYQTNVEALSKQINTASNIVSLGFTSITREQSINYTLLVTDIICGTLESFVIILFVVVILVLSNSINTNIEMDYTNIGILKSQGFTKLQIRLVLILQYLLSGILGALFGLLLALPLVKQLRNLFVNSSGLLFSSSISIMLSGGILALVLLFIGIFILFKTRKIAKISPINAITGGLDDIYFKNLIETPVLGKSKRFLNLRLAFRQITTNTKWYVGTGLIIALLVSFLCMSASFKETFTEQYYNELFGVIHGDVFVEYEDDTTMIDKVEHTIASISPIKDKFHNGSQYVLIDGEQNFAQVLDNTTYLKSILEGRAPQYDNEIVITNLLKNQLGKTIGDTVEIQVKETKKDYIITGIYDSCSDIGRCFAITLDGIRRVMPDYELTSYEYVLTDASKKAAAIKAVNDAYAKNTTVMASKPSSMNQNSIDTIMMTSNIVVLCICMISVIFAIIVICMICNKMYLKEKQTLGIYKAYGFTSNSLRFQYCFRFLFVAILGCILGGIAFIFFGNDINSGILELAGISSYSAPITWFNLGFPILLICATVFVSSFVTMKKVKKVDVKSLIVE